MLTGARAFEGESVTEVAGAVIHKEPDWGALPATTPPTIQMVVRRCLQKDARQRFRDMGDVRLAIDGAFTTGAATTAGSPVVVRRNRGTLIGIAAAAVLAALGAGGTVWLLTRTAAGPREMVRFDVAPSAPGTLSPLINISPDGRSVSFVALDDDGVPRIWIKPLDASESRILVPGEQTRGPTFWSADSRYLAYAFNGKLRKAPVGGGPPETIVEVENYAGGTWNQDGLIAFSTMGAIMSVPSTGGAAMALTALDKARGETAHLLPWFLPDGRHFLYLRAS
jgi:hypothetical protein